MFDEFTLALFARELGVGIGGNEFEYRAQGRCFRERLIVQQHQQADRAPLVVLQTPPGVGLNVERF